jgi:hypothetical protein
MAIPAQNRRLNILKQRTDTDLWRRPAVDEAQVWPELIRRIQEGRVVPVISNGFRLNQVFDIDDDDRLGLATEMVPGPDTGLSIEEELAEQWAEQIGYPLPDKYNLARVALYNRIRMYDARQANARYLDFLKFCLLSLATADETVVEQIEPLRRQLNHLTFSDIATTLAYPKFQVGQEDPLQLLARLPLPIYLTTSFHDFLERALRAEGKNPTTQICFWAGEPGGVAPEHLPDPNLIPSVEAPLVYHLFGFELYPESLVLSEDDYLQFLIKVSQRPDWERGVLPVYLQAALAHASLLLVGYKALTWDFKILFQGLTQLIQPGLRRLSFLLHPEPRLSRENGSPEMVKPYLEAYCEAAKFRVVWGETDNFIERLWQEWEINKT